MTQTPTADTEVREILRGLNEITQNMPALLERADWDALTEQLEKRAALLHKMEVHKRGQIADRQDMDLVGSYTALNDRIIACLKQQMGSTLDSLESLRIEKRAIGNLQAIANKRNRHRVNFQY
ncbi:MAG: hypothetical protein ACE5HO_11760 [bacterium]